MKKKYAHHPMDFAIGENEKFYADMAARGWLLDKRGGYFSRFVEGKPQALRYRIELSQPLFLDETAALPEEQVALYEDCGWQYITSRGLLHIFSAPEGSGAPEFYSDPRQQAATLKSLRRSYLLGLLGVLVIVGIQVFFYLSFSSQGLGRLAAELYTTFISNTALLLLSGAMLLDLLYLSLYSLWRVAKLYRQLSRGIPIDHAPQKRDILHRSICMLLTASELLASVLVLSQFLQAQNYPMPASMDGLYLTFAELGVPGERTTSSIDNKESQVRFEQSLLARHWDTREFVAAAQPDQLEYWMYQDVFLLKKEELAPCFVQSLLHHGTFNETPGDYRFITHPGLDEVYQGRNELVVRRGNVVWEITLIETPDVVGYADVLDAIAAKQLV